MKEFWNVVQAVFAALGGWLGWFLGGCDGLIYALVAFVVIDYLTAAFLRTVMHSWRASKRRKRTMKITFSPVTIGSLPVFITTKVSPERKRKSDRSCSA